MGVELVPTGFESLPPMPVPGQGWVLGNLK